MTHRVPITACCGSDIAFGNTEITPPNGPAQMVSNRGIREGRKRSRSGQVFFGREA